MAALLQFAYYITNGLLTLLVWAIIISAVMSWLVAFDVINLRNRFAYNLVRALEAVTRPVLGPFQRIIPSLGGVDISPIIAILVITGIQQYLLPALFNFLLRTFSTARPASSTVQPSTASRPPRGVTRTASRMVRRRRCAAGS
jgi:YggT family protein